MDTGLLLGRQVPASAFNDTTLGRAMDAIFETGTEQLFSQVAFRAASVFPEDMDMQHVHFDTTSGQCLGRLSALYGPGGSASGEFGILQGQTS